MIRCDKEAMEILQTRDFDIVIPFEIQAPEAGEPVVTCARGLSSFARRFLSEYRGDYFQKEAILAVRQHVTDFILPFGYEEDPASRTYIYQYTADASWREQPGILQPASARITEAFPQNRTTFPVRKLLREGHLVTGTVVDGAIVSVAATHAPVLDADIPADTLVEIGTETAPAFRGYGYASSNVALLTKLLRQSGLRVQYCCTDRNRKSCRIAVKTGFTLESRRYCYVGRRL